jgi:hypothetical protein
MNIIREKKYKCAFGNVAAFVKVRICLKVSENIQSEPRGIKSCFLIAKSYLVTMSHLWVSNNITSFL